MERNDLISSQTQGVLASYKVDGIDTAVTSDSRTISLAPGLQVQLLAASTAGSATTITVQPDATSLESSLSAFASAYNAVVDAIGSQHGQNAGALQGDSILNNVTSVLQNLGTFSNGTPDASLAAFGVTLDSAGHLSVDSTAFQAAATSNFKGLVSLIGSAGNGGLINSATSALNGLEDSTTGTLKAEETQVSSEITATQNKITDKQSQVNQLQSNLQQQMASADAAIATLEQQVTYLTGLFTAERTYTTQNQ